MSGDSCTYSGLQLFKHCYTFNYLLCSYSNSFLIIFNIILCRFFFFSFLPTGHMLSWTSPRPHLLYLLLFTLHVPMQLQRPK